MKTFSSKNSQSSEIFDFSLKISWDLLDQLQIQEFWTQKNEVLRIIYPIYNESVTPAFLFKLVNLFKAK